MTTTTPRRLATLALAAACTVAGLASAQEAELPVKAVTLYTSGVGFFEHNGTVADGQSTSTLRFSADQINDLLKSLVVQDLDGGTIDSVTYAATGPLNRQLSSFQIDLSGTPSLASLLGQLKGARISIETDDVDPIVGTVVGIDERSVADGDVEVAKAFVTLFTGSSLASVAIDDVTNFEILDEKLRDELAAALEAVAAARDKDKRSVGLSFQGEGERRVRVGYVVETPVWKTSYRLLLGDEPTMQGWAIVENQTDFDWQDVRLGLVSGRPISFEMPLGDPLYADRPQVEVPKPPSVRPRAYGGGTRASALRDAPMSRASLPATAAMESMDQSPNFQSKADYSGLQAGSVQGSSTDRGALFEYRVASVSIDRQTSAMIPVISETVKAEPVSLFDPSQNLSNPMTAVLFENVTDKHLPAGPVTVFDAEGYAGEAQITDVPGGQSRLIAFGVDLDLLVRAEGLDGEEVITAGSISDGVLTLQRRLRQQVTYVIDNQADEEKTVILLHRVDDSEIEGDLKPYEETDDGIGRFRVTAAVGVTEAPIVRSRILENRYRLFDNEDLEQLVFLTERGELPAELREAMTEAAAKLRAVNDSQRTIDAIENELETIADEQGRLRKNMDNVDRGSDYYKRLLKKLNDQETRIEELRTRRTEVAAERDKRREAYREFIRSLDL